MPLAAMLKSRNSHPTASVCNVDADRIPGCPDHRYSQALNCVEVEIILLVTIKGQENVDAGFGIIAFD